MTFSHAPFDAEPSPTTAAVDLYWLPLGAGGHSVAFNGRVYEAIAARAAKRPERDLYHSALEVRVAQWRYTIEMTPVPDGLGARRGVVAEGPVGARWAGRLRIFRYEIRRWLDGEIPDVASALASPVHLTCERERAQRLLDLVPGVPTAVWGRDDLETGDMWNSNSVVSWLLASAGFDMDAIAPPAGGRAPGWDAGLVVARRHAARVAVRS
jgi:hypothetical protein